MTTMTVGIDRLRIETLRALTVLAEEHRLPAPKWLSMKEFTDPDFTSLDIELDEGDGSRPGVDGWARVLGLPAPTVQRYSNNSGWHEEYVSCANKDKPVWLGWTLVEVTCTVARGGAK